MAEAVLFNTADRILANLGSSALQGIASIRGFKEELGKLETAISAIKAVLLDAEEKRIGNHQVRDWLQKLEDAVYDADELVDEFHTEALRRRVTPGGKVVNVHSTIFVTIDFVEGCSFFGKYEYGLLMLI
ncbi:hypothetical protein FNV43_RR19524 [Rhamnella rubrinervis]|uniref:Disease resistance N-terminal domain-containing protein n=1 Tax=Rhamnella rubrinervis TaxID=2594499 RepID=A0A8K0DXZ1_9ROSA|nr:hypothetical protein FNV43_RR19524 [Rhamnella rubrinervis]